ncbi:hypothetical protein [Streptomyces sp. WAC01526]|uniref:hypothetical protein n=1 Tax=Streptomyces sp. WAC01526 TaxID=2588709 RepID=UPI0037DD420F
MIGGVVGHAYRFSNLRLNGHRQVRVHTGIGRDNRRDVYQDRRAYVWDNIGDAATCTTTTAASSTLAARADRGLGDGLIAPARKPPGGMAAVVTRGSGKSYWSKQT